METACSDGAQFVLKNVPWTLLEADIAKEPELIFGMEPSQILRNSGETQQSAVYTYPCSFSGYEGEILLCFINGTLDFVRVDFNEEDPKRVYAELLAKLEQVFGEAEAGEAVTISEDDGGTGKIPMVYYWMSDETELRFGCDAMALSEGVVSEVFLVISGRVSEH